jgi:hypothetical protein
MAQLASLGQLFCFRRDAIDRMPTTLSTSSASCGELRLTGAPARQDHPRMPDRMNDRRE